MSNNRSIDGLQRRTTSSSVAKRTVTKGRTTSIKTAKKPITKPATRRQIGIDANKKANRATLKRQEELKLQPKKVESAEELAVKEYLAEVKDVDPTDLVEISQEEKGKGWFKKSKKKTKKDKPKKKRHIVRWIVITIILAIIGVGVLAFSVLRRG